MRGVIKLGKWLLALAIVSALVGSAAAFFLWSLEEVTQLRFSNSWLIFLLPVAGLAIGYYYHTHGREVVAGNELIYGKVYDPSRKISHRLSPSILFATLATHLFGGSAGREGTAVQMGAGIAFSCSSFLSDSEKSARLLTLCGVAAGFGAVFGTPFAGAVFAGEFVRKRVISFALIPYLLTALGAHLVCMAWGTEHTAYPAIVFEKDLSTYLPILWKVFVVAAAIAIASRLFIRLSETATDQLKALFPHLPLRAAFGGILIVGMFLLVGTDDYLGLGTAASSESSVTLPRMFSAETDVPYSAWIWKMLFTIVTLSAGFKGGEVTPLFFIGAALGNSLAWILNAPIDLFAGISMIAFFAAATKTPYASLIMGIELLGWHVFAPLALCTFTAWKFSGSKSIYPEPPPKS